MGAMFGPWGAAAGAVGGGALGVIGASQQNKANAAFENQKKNAQDDLIIENQRRATHDYLRQVRLEQLQATQEAQSVAEQSQDVRKQAAGATGQARADAAERGVAGNSLEMIVNDYEFQQNQEIGRLRQNQEMKNAQHGENIAGFKDQFDQRVAAVRPYIARAQPPVDYFGPVFGVVSTVAQLKNQSPSGSITKTTNTPDAAFQKMDKANEDAWTSQVGRNR
jgi:hypothetical protein